ncbi:PIG-L deacetylase family protein [Verrucomicrobiota bacterium]
MLAPHPDDFDAIGVTMRFFRDNGNPIYVAVLSPSASGVQDTFCSSPTLEKKARIREQEQRESCRFFGLPESYLTFLNLEEDDTGQPMDSHDNCRHIEEHFAGVRPDFVFLPSGNDTNSGHRATCSMFKKIASAASYPITGFLNRDQKTVSMRHDLLTVFGPEDAEWKAKLLRFHQSQHQRNLNQRHHGFDERILSVNREIARELPGPDMYAEAFELDEPSRYPRPSA